MSPIHPEPRKGPGSFARQLALATELPFVLAGGAVAGGFLGFLLDRWWHTKPLLMILLGAVGFFAGLRDVLRRLQKDDSDSQSKPGS